MTEKKQLLNHKQKLQRLYETIPIDYLKIKEGYWEFSVLGSKTQWIEWLEKFGLLLKELEKEGPR